MKSKHLAILAIAGLTVVSLGHQLNRSVVADVVQPEAIAQVAAIRHPAVYTENGVALDGQDVVAYFTQSAVVEGSTAYSLQWNGTTWLFSSAANRDLFTQNPGQYAPQYGGYCAKAAAGGVLATTIPTAWGVRGGKLYLNYSADAQREWQQDTETKIIQANANWPGILDNETLKR